MDIKNKYYYLLNLIFFFIIINYLFAIINFKNNISNWVLVEWLINYQGGLVRRGFLGEVINQYYNFTKNSQPIIIVIFSSIAYLIIIFYYYSISKEFFKKNIFLGLIITLSPATLLFGIYDIQALFRKEVFILALILYHAHIAKLTLNKTNDFDEYIFKLKFIIITFLSINILIHEIQFFFLAVHVLITLIILKNKNYKKKILNFYFIPLIMFIFISYKSIQFTGTNDIRNSLIQYPTQLIFQDGNPIYFLEGNFFLIVGSLIKLFFAYNYFQFLELFFSFILSVGIILFLLNIFVKKKNKFIIYFNYTILCIAIVLLLITFDFGRALHILSIHIIAFFYIFDLKKINLKYIYKIIISFFTFMYIFLWNLPHAYIGYQGTIYSSGIMNVIKKDIASIFFILPEKTTKKIPLFIHSELQKYKNND